MPALTTHLSPCESFQTELRAVEGFLILCTAFPMAQHTFVVRGISATHCKVASNANSRLVVVWPNCTLRAFGTQRRLHAAFSLHSVLRTYPYVRTQVFCGLRISFSGVFSLEFLLSI